MTFLPTPSLAVEPYGENSNVLHSPPVSIPAATVTTSTGTRTQMYREPPRDVVDYNNNPSVFGKILRGELPADVIDETTNLLFFHDIHPRAPLHALIIPKRYIPTVFDLAVNDLPLLYEMREMGAFYLKQHYPKAYRQSDYRLVIHVPPFNSVNHLHLHVMAPASAMTSYHRFFKYRGDNRWCYNMDSVIRRLEEGSRPLPYAKPPL